MCIAVLGFRSGGRLVVTTEGPASLEELRSLYRASAALYIPSEVLRLDLRYGALLDVVADLFLLPILGAEGCRDVLRGVERFRARAVAEAALLTILDLRSRGLSGLLPLIRAPLSYFPVYKASLRVVFNPYILRVFAECRDAATCLRELGEEFRVPVEEAAASGYLELVNGYARLRPLSSIGLGRALRQLLMLRASAVALRIVRNAYRGGAALWGHSAPCLEGPLIRVLINPYTLLEVDGVKLGYQDFKRSADTPRLDLLDRIATDVAFGSCGGSVCIAKRYLTPKSAKWVAAKFTRFLTVDFWVSPGVRMANEIVFTRILSGIGVAVPRIIAADLETYTLYREYIEGEPLTRYVCSTRLDVFEKTGSVLAKIHSRGLSLGDTRPSNFIVSGGRVYVVDLEQVRVGGDPSWDLAELLYFIAFECESRCRGGNKLLYFLRYARGVIKGYVCSGGDPSVVGRASSRRFSSVFSLLLTPITSERYRRAIEGVARLATRVSGC